jgi:FMN hydrolase / 5-amino-6-(5-phospho-D-ribitylamino)uracil phosphatase
MKAILFDVMSTLVYDPFYIDLPREFGVSLRELLHGRDHNAWLEFERDEINEEQFYARFFQETASIDGPRMTSAIFDNYRYLDGIEEILSILQGECRLATLSNYPVWFEHLKEKLNLEKYMDEFFVSYQLGVRKPDEEAYLIPVKKLRLDTADCVFVDDRQENCTAAIALGMKAIHFQNSIQLRVELEKLKLL